MTRIGMWLEEYPMLVGIAFGGLVLAVLTIVFGTLMLRSGLSLKPLVWFIVLVVLVANPQAVVHGLDVAAFQLPAATTTDA
jgi:hypothetical protein